MTKILLALLLSAANTLAAPLPFTGVNLAGAEFGDNNLPGTYNYDYIYPNQAEVDYFAGKGMNVFRLAFRWERLQQTLHAPLDTTELARLDAFVAATTAKGHHVILDPHNYARYRIGTTTHLIGSAALPNSALDDLWSRLATLYKNNPRVIFGLMTEPNTMPTETWLSAANDAIAAIRATGATNLILVPGNAWTGAHSWLQSWYGTPNGTVMLGVVDPADNFAFDMHQYLDGDSSGTTTTTISPTIGSERLAVATNWLRANGHRAFLAEFGGYRDAIALAALDDILDHVEANADVWIGWAYWAAGPWWGDYIFTLEPNASGDRPQMSALFPHTQITLPTPTLLPTGSAEFLSHPGHYYHLWTGPAPNSLTRHSTEIPGDGSQKSIPVPASLGSPQFYLRLEVSKQAEP